MHNFQCFSSNAFPLHKNVLLTSEILPHGLNSGEASECRVKMLETGPLELKDKDVLGDKRGQEDYKHFAYEEKKVGIV